MSAITRLGSSAVGLAAYGTFLPKPLFGGGHSPGLITRLGQSAVGLAAYGTFLPKPSSGAVESSGNWLPRQRRRGRR